MALFLAVSFSVLCDGRYDGDRAEDADDVTQLRVGLRIEPERCLLKFNIDLSRQLPQAIGKDSCHICGHRV
jgi:hypothetical protein